MSGNIKARLDRLQAEELKRKDLPPMDAVLETLSDPELIAMQRAIAVWEDTGKPYDSQPFHGEIVGGPPVVEDEPVTVEAASHSELRQRAAQKTRELLATRFGEDIAKRLHAGR
jgi:hypothetical protein